MVLLTSSVVSFKAAWARASLGSGGGQVWAAIAICKRNLFLEAWSGACFLPFELGFGKVQFAAWLARPWSR